MKSCNILIAPLVFSLALLCLSGRSDTNTAEPDAAQIRNAVRLLQSPNPAQRAATYKACRERGEDFRPTYRKMLEQARAHHVREFQSAVNNSPGARTPAGQLRDAWRDWESASASAREFAQTDHRKDSRKLAEMDRRFAEAESAWMKMLQQRDKAGLAAADPVAQRIESASLALGEVLRELAWCDNPDQSVNEPNIADLERKFGLGTIASDYLGARSAVDGVDSALKAAHAANQREKWANNQQIAFARILNDRRSVLGLPPLRLNERLSNACRAHSEEMARLNYFSHNSPIKENKTFGKRAVKAGFHGATGECIFMGSTDPAEAEKAWWHSCDHRLINYASGPDTLGIGIHNTHWTLNTGRSKRAH